MSKATHVVQYRLNNFAGVTALVGAGASARIYPDALPQGVARPAIIYTEIDSRRLRGAWSDPGVAHVTVRVTAVADTRAAADDVIEQARLALERYASQQPGGTLVDGVLVYDIRAGVTVGGYIEEVNVFAASMEFEVVHVEAVS